MAKGLQTKPPKANKNATGAKKWQKQTQRSDVQLGQIAKGQIAGIGDAYSQPLDYSQAPTAPVTGDYNNWVNEQMGNYNKAFDERYNPVFAEQNEDIDQQLANKGIPMGSELYEREKNRILQSQNDARTQAYAQGQAQAVNSAGQLFDIGTQARGNSLAEMQAQRNQPLTDYANLMSAQSGLGMNQLQYKQDLGKIKAQGDEQIRVSNATYRGGGGGGGSTAWGDYGFSTPQELDAYRVAQARDQATWAANLAKGNAEKKPNAYAGLIGGALGAGLQGWASNGFEW